MTAPKMMKGINAITTNANFQPETKARARHPTAVIKDEAMVPKRGPVALIKKKMQKNSSDYVKNINQKEKCRKVLNILFNSLFLSRFLSCLLSIEIRNGGIHRNESCTVGPQTISR